MREDEVTFSELLKHLGSSTDSVESLKLATGYLNLMDSYKTHLFDLMKKDKNAKVDLLVASPKANGFYKAGKVKKYIPGLYRLNALDLVKKARKTGLQDQLRLKEYENGDWTYHAKGAWVYEKLAEDLCPELPTMTVVGSSNFSYRSNRRDTEV